MHRCWRMLWRRSQLCWPTRGCPQQSPHVGCTSVVSAVEATARSWTRPPRLRYCRAGSMRHGGVEMLDDLDLAWEDQEPRRRRGAPPSRQARQRKRKERGRRRRSYGALFISVLLLATLGGGVYWGLGKISDYFGAPDYDS